MAKEPGRPATLVHKIWRAHLVAPPTHDDVVAVDRILLHERQVGLLARHPVAGQLEGGARVVACADQQMPTSQRARVLRDAQHVAALERLERDTDTLGVPVFGPGDPRAGILNVVAAEQGLVLPGQLVVGADPHVATLGALGVLALRVDDHELPEVVATGRLHRDEPSTMRVSITGRLGAGATAKDLALWLLARLGPTGGQGRVVELAGEAVRGLGMEGRMTLANMACETAADAVIVEPDAVSADYLAGRPFAPAEWTSEAAARCRELASDGGAPRDGEVGVVAEEVGAWVTWGTGAWQAAPLDGVVPSPHRTDPALARADEEALRLQDLQPGTPFDEVEVDQVFIGSCANARIDDLRAAAEVARRGGRVQVRSWVVPGSWVVKRQAEAEGLHRVFLDAGFEWREPGCSLCIGANGDAVAPGTRLASTANRPAHGRVGPRSRVHLLSPASAVATALTGRLVSAERLAR